MVTNHDSEPTLPNLVVHQPCDNLAFNPPLSNLSFSFLLSSKDSPVVQIVDVLQGDLTVCCDYLPRLELFDPGLCLGLLVGDEWDRDRPEMLHPSMMLVTELTVKMTQPKQYSTTLATSVT
jgi:hypothetical protein